MKLRDSIGAYGHPWRGGLAVAALLSLGLVCAGCAHEAARTLPPPPVEGSWSVDPPGTLSRAALDRDLRSLTEQCDRARDALEGRVKRAQRRRVGEAGAAAVACIVGQVADQSGHPDPSAPGGPNECRDTALSTPAMCYSTQIPNLNADSESAAEQKVRTTKAKASRSLAQIDGAVDAMDAFLFQSPNPTLWRPEEHARWREVRAGVVEACSD